MKKVRSKSQKEHQMSQLRGQEEIEWLQVRGDLYFSTVVLQEEIKEITQILINLLTLLFY
jgi:hypothetical protein